MQISALNHSSQKTSIGLGNFYIRGWCENKDLKIDPESSALHLLPGAISKR